MSKDIDSIIEDKLGEVLDSKKKIKAPLGEKINNWGFILGSLLYLDVVTTLVLLYFNEFARELNPLLNHFNNIPFAVVFSHILAIGVVILMCRRLQKDTHEQQKKGLLGLRIVSIFYLIVVLFNSFQVVLTFM